MGSDVNVYLVTDSNLRKIIAREIQKKQAGCIHYDQRFTGTWEHEKFCTFSDIAAVIDDVIKKRQSTCSTYSKVNDLIELPDSIPAETVEKHFDRVIFRIYREGGVTADIICGKARFRCHRIDLTHCSEELGLERGYWYEFAEYELQNTLSSYNDTVGFSTLHANRFVKTVITYLRKLYKRDAEYGLDDFQKRQAELAKQMIAKFFNLPKLSDDYERYIHRDPYLKHIEDLHISHNEDYTKMVYSNPFIEDYRTFGCFFPDNYDLKTSFEELYFHFEEKFTYSELFHNGIDMKYLLCAYSSRSKSKEELDDLDYFAVLMDVFS